MDFNDKVLKVLLQALYRFRGEVSGGSQSEQNRLELVASVIDKIESKVGPIKPQKTQFDREMEESLAVLATGKAGAAKAKAAPKLDKDEDAPKVKRVGTTKTAGKSPRAAAPKAAKTSGPSKAGSARTAKTRSK